MDSFNNDVPSTHSKSMDSNLLRPDHPGNARLNSTFNEGSGNMEYYCRICLICAFEGMPKRASVLECPYCGDKFNFHHKLSRHLFKKFCRGIRSDLKCSECGRWENDRSVDMNFSDISVDQNLLESSSEDSEETSHNPLTLNEDSDQMDETEQNCKSAEVFSNSSIYIESENITSLSEESNFSATIFDTSISDKNKEFPPDLQKFSYDISIGGFASGTVSSEVPLTSPKHKPVDFASWHSTPAKYVEKLRLKVLNSETGRQPSSSAGISTLDDSASSDGSLSRTPLSIVAFKGRGSSSKRRKPYEKLRIPQRLNLTDSPRANYSREDNLNRSRREISNESLCLNVEETSRVNVVETSRVNVDLLSNVKINFPHPNRCLYILLSKDKLYKSLTLCLSTPKSVSTETCSQDSPGYSSSKTISPSFEGSSSVTLTLPAACSSKLTLAPPTGCSSNGTLTPPGCSSKVTLAMAAACSSTPMLANIPRYSRSECITCKNSFQQKSETLYYLRLVCDCDPRCYNICTICQRTVQVQRLIKFSLRVCRWIIRYRKEMFCIFCHERYATEKEGCEHIVQKRCYKSNFSILSPPTFTEN